MKQESQRVTKRTKCITYFSKISYVIPVNGSSSRRSKNENNQENYYSDE